MTDGTDTDDDMTMTGDYPGWDVMVLLVIVALLPAAFATGFSQFEHLKEWILVGGVGLATALWAVRLAFADEVRLEAARIAVLGLVFAVYVLASIFWVSSWDTGLANALPVVAAFAAFWIALSGKHRPTFSELSVAVAVGILVSGLLGFLDWVGVSTFSVVWDPPGAAGAFDGMEFAAAYYMVALPIALAGAVRFSGKRSLLMAVAVGVGGLHFGATASWTLMMVLVGSVTGAGLLAAFFQPEEAEVMTPAAGGILAILLAGIVAGHSQYGAPEGMEESVSVPLLSETTSSEQQRLEQNRPWNPVYSIGRMETVDSYEARRYLAGVGYNLWRNRPALGHGAGAWWQLQTNELLAEHPAVQRRFHRYAAYRSPHNAVVRVGVEYGLIGGALLLIWLFAGVGLAVRAIGRDPEPVERLAEQWGLIGALVSGAGAALLTAFWSISPAVLTWILALAVLLRISSEMTPAEGGAVDWEFVSPTQTGWTAGRAVAVAVTGVLAVGMVVASTLHGTSRLYRGYADHMMVLTAYQKASKRYERSNDWWPRPGDVAYNQALAEERSVGGAEDVGTLLERAVALRPHDTRVLASRAKYALRQDEAPKATRFAYRAVEAYPNSFVARSMLTTSLQHSGRHSEAASELIEYLDRKPPPALEVQTRQSLAKLYMAMEEPANAKEHLEAAIDIAEERSTRKALEKELGKVKERIKQRRRREEGKLPEEDQEKMPPSKKPGPTGPNPFQ